MKEIEGNHRKEKVGNVTTQKSKEKRASSTIPENPRLYMLMEMMIKLLNRRCTNTISVARGELCKEMQAASHLTKKIKQGQKLTTGKQFYLLTFVSDIVGRLTPKQFSSCVQIEVYVP